MGKYYANGNVAVLSTTYKTALAIIGGTGVRPKLCEAEWGTDTAGDFAIEFLLQRLTANGTGTSVTPKPCDSAEPATEVTAGSNYTAEPTYTVGETPWDVSQHQKSVRIWQALDQEARIVVPATANNGLGIQFKSASSTPKAKARFLWDE